MAELNEQMLRAIIMDIMDEVGMLKEEPVQVQPKEELKSRASRARVKRFDSSNVGRYAT